MSYAPPSMRVLGSARASRAVIGAPPITSPRAAAPVPKEEFERRFLICFNCPWNIDWACQHSGCKTCPGAQKKLGAEPLKHLLATPFFKCPMKKF